MSKLAERLRSGRNNESKKAIAIEQYLTFLLAEQEYGVDILSVQEIRGWEPVMAIPNAPSYLQGVINLRGIVIPIVNLRVRFGLAAQAPSPLTVVIILRVKPADLRIGVVVDAVSEVYDIAKAQIHPPPQLEQDHDLDYIGGIATLKNKMISLISIEKLFDVERMTQFSASTMSMRTEKD